MTARKGHRDPNATSYKGMTAQRMAAGMMKLQQANAARTPCQHCGLQVTPGGLARHIEIHHTDDD